MQSTTCCLHVSVRATTSTRGGDDCAITALRTHVLWKATGDTRGAVADAHGVDPNLPNVSSLRSGVTETSSHSGSLVPLRIGTDGPRAKVLGSANLGKFQPGSNSNRPAGAKPGGAVVKAIDNQVKALDKQVEASVKRFERDVKNLTGGANDTSGSENGDG